MRTVSCSVLAAVALLSVVALPGAAGAASARPLATASAPITGTPYDLQADGQGVRAILPSVGGPPLSASTSRIDRFGAGPATSLIAEDGYDLIAARFLPAGGTLTAHTTTSEGTIGNELLVRMDSPGAPPFQQRLNSPSTQASSLRGGEAFGPTGAVALPFNERTLPYGSQEYSDYAIAVRAPGAAAFSAPQEIFPRGQQRYRVLDSRTYLGPDGGGWTFLLPSGDDWRRGYPVEVLARRIQPDGRLGALLRMPLPFTRPVNASARMEAEFLPDGRLLTVFSAAGYVREQERAAVWSRTFAADTVTPPPSVTVQKRAGGYDETYNFDLAVTPTGQATVLAQTATNLRLFRLSRSRNAWRPGARLQARYPSQPRLLRLSDGQLAAVWLEPRVYGRIEYLRLATGSRTAERWRVREVAGLKPFAPGGAFERLDAAVALPGRRVAVAIYRRGEQVIFLQVDG